MKLASSVCVGMSVVFRLRVGWRRERAGGETVSSQAYHIIAKVSGAVDAR